MEHRSLYRRRHARLWFHAHDINGSPHLLVIYHRTADGVMATGRTINRAGLGADAPDNGESRNPDSNRRRSKASDYWEADSADSCFAAVAPPSAPPCADGAADFPIEISSTSKSRVRSASVPRRNIHSRPLIMAQGECGSCHSSRSACTAPFPTRATALLG